MSEFHKFFQLWDNFEQQLEALKKKIDPSLHHEVDSIGAQARHIAGEVSKSEVEQAPAVIEKAVESK